VRIFQQTEYASDAYITTYDRYITNQPNTLMILTSSHRVL